MALTAEQVIVTVDARMARLRTEVQQATSAWERGMAQIRKSGTSTEDSIRRSSDRIGGTLRTLAGTLASYFTGRELIGLTDAFTRFQNSLRVAGVEGADLAQVQNALFASAQRYGVELETLGQLFGRASQAAAGLGASQQQLLQFTNSIAAAVRVQGGSVEQASGALLQLAQALQSGTVRAEEFNSINEGLFPVLQAVAAGSERFGGSVARLRAAVIDGTVSSREFFDSFQRGADTLEQRAERAALTTAAGFTTLRNALTVYFGEADKTAGVSAALGEAIKTLADNLDTVIPALAVIATGLGVGFVTNAIAARVAVGGLGTAMLAAFGGPIGIAITGVTIALASFAVEAANTEAAVARLEGGVAQAQAKLDEARDRAERAGVAVNSLAAETSAAHPIMLGIAQALDIAATAAGRYANMARTAAIASANLRLIQTREDRQRLEGTQRLRALNPVAGGVSRFFGPSSERVEAAIRAGRAQEALIQEEIRNLQATPESAFDRGGAPPAPAGGGAGRRGGDPEAEANRRREEQQRLDAEIDQAYGAYLQALIRTAQSSAERASLEREAVEHTQAANAQSINNDERLDDAQRAELLKYNNLIAALEQRRINQEEQRRLTEQNLDLTLAELDNQQQMKRAQLDLATTSEERRRMELELLDLAYQEQIARLAAIEANENLDPLVREKARVDREGLESRRGVERESVLRRTASPGEAYLQQLRDQAEAVNDALERIQVEGLQSLTDGLAQAIVGTKSLGDVFKDVANQIIADLIRIAIQRIIVGTLANLLFGGTGGFDAIGFGAKIFGGLGGAGWATGGSAVLGGRPGVDQNMLNLNGQPIARVSRGERVTVTPQGKALSGVGGAAMMPGMAQPLARVQIELSGDIDGRIASVSGPVAVEIVRAAAPQIAANAKAETLRAVMRPRLNTA